VWRRSLNLFYTWSSSGTKTSTGEKRTCEGGGANMPHVCDGHAIEARDSRWGPWETAQLSGSPNKMEQQLETRIAYMGRGKPRTELLYVGRRSSTLFVVNIGHTTLPPHPAVIHWGTSIQRYDSFDIY
jgi:hypothetical protein